MFPGNQEARLRKAEKRPRTQRRAEAAGNLPVASVQRGISRPLSRPLSEQREGLTLQWTHPKEPGGSSGLHPLHRPGLSEVPLEGQGWRHCPWCWTREPARSSAQGWLPPAPLAAHTSSSAPTPPPGETGNAHGHCTVTPPCRQAHVQGPNPTHSLCQVQGESWEWGGQGEGTPAPGLQADAVPSSSMPSRGPLCFPRLRSRTQGPAPQAAHSSSLELQAALPRPAGACSISVLTAGLMPQHRQEQVT